MCVCVFRDKAFFNRRKSACINTTKACIVFAEAALIERKKCISEVLWSTFMTECHVEPICKVSRTPPVTVVGINRHGRMIPLVISLHMRVALVLRSCASGSSR